MTFAMRFRQIEYLGVAISFNFFISSTFATNMLIYITLTRYNVARYHCFRAEISTECILNRWFVSHYPTKDCPTERALPRLIGSV